MTIRNGEYTDGKMCAYKHSFLETQGKVFNNNKTICYQQRITKIHTYHHYHEGDDDDDIKTIFLNNMSLKPMVFQHSG